MTNLKEKDLHPFLVKWCADQWHLACKTIDQSKSKNKNKGENEWVHPDIVGAKLNPFRLAQVPFSETVGAFYQQQHKQVELYSFELKLSVTLGTLKKYYFQAVSNSSWANYGYLVTADLNVFDDVLMDELSRLVQAFGIGVILLKPGALSQSRVLFESRHREQLDFHTMDKIAYKIENADFKNFLNGVNSCLETQHNQVAVSSILTNPVHFDAVLSEDELKAQYLLTHQSMTSKKDTIDIQKELQIESEPTGEDDFFSVNQLPSLFQPLRTYTPNYYKEKKPTLVKINGQLSFFTTWKNFLRDVCLLIREVQPIRFQQYSYPTEDFSATLFYKDEGDRWVSGKLKKGQKIELDEDLFLISPATIENTMTTEIIVSLLFELIEVFELPDDWIKISF